MPNSLLLMLAALLAAIVPPAARAAPAHGIAMHGDLKYPAGFAHFDYVNADAPKGGEFTFGTIRGFDTFNPFIVRGRHAPYLRDFVFESLLTRSLDEPFSLYGLLASGVEMPADRSWVEFTLDERARFSDGRPVTVEDVVYSLALLRDFGRPNHRVYYAKVARIEETGPRRIRFVFRPDEPDREMPLIIGLMPVLPKHIYTRERFERAGLDLPVGSGPYVVESFSPGERLTYRRNPNYWGRDLPVNRGFYNFDRVKFLFYRDNNVLFEDFKKGAHHLRLEEDPNRWALAYDFPAIADKRVTRTQLPLSLPAPMQALAFNTRRPIFRQPQVREALVLLFDFDWINQNLFHGLYRRTRSFFDRSELSTADRPADASERALLAPFPSAVRPDIMQRGWVPETSDGTGRNRKSRSRALAMLREAGYELRDAKMVDVASGAPLSFEILSSRSEQERLLLSYVAMLRQVGIDARVRIVDNAQYEQRKTSFDFDMIDNDWASSLSPGNEQNFRWSAKAAGENGSYNFAGVADPAVDAMIEAMLKADNRASFVSAVRALDRVLLSGHYVVPLFHLPGQWVALWQPFSLPQTPSFYGLRLDTLWQSTASYER